MSNLLRQGQGVQEGREVQAAQAVQGYHHYQGDQEGPVIVGQRKKWARTKSKMNLKTALMSAYP